MGFWENDRVLNSIGGNTVAWDRDRENDKLFCRCCGTEIDDDCKSYCADCSHDIEQEKE